MPLVSATADLLREDPMLRAVQVELEGSAQSISADADLLRAVFQNLLLNAAQVMQGHGRIRVTVTAVDATCHDAFIVLYHQVARYRPGPADREALIEAHQGRIAVDCPAGGGTVVTVQLPA